MKKGFGKVNAKTMKDLPKPKETAPKKAVMKQKAGKRGKYVEDHYGGYPIR